MTVLMLIALVTMQSGHANYKKMYTDESQEGCYYLMILTLNVWWVPHTSHNTSYLPQHLIPPTIRHTTKITQYNCSLYRLYLPAMLFILMDTFTASVFPTDYYEQFYIYLYITP